ncbi:MAG: cbb3-type cytochrome c oxidase subunit I [Betaproteobacteria bacterium]|nr:cbb3-type cytochrome c oxidase subunit I [Betaproteobacteria bacterium]
MSQPVNLQYAVDYALTVPDDARRTLARGWLWLGLLALIGSGVFSVLLVLSRTPVLQNLLPLADFFHVALVVHVDLSVLVWFISQAGMLWSINSSTRALLLAKTALWLCASGAVLLSLAPFFGWGEAIMANYIPVLNGPLFLSGLVLFATGFALLVLRSLVLAPILGRRFDAGGALRFGLNASVVSAAVALLAFGWSYAAVPDSLSGKAYYEILFWGGGHALQFTWTLLMLVAWLWLTSAIGARVPLSPRIALLMFLLALLCVFVTPYAYLAYPIASVEHRNLLTWAMRFGGGLAILPMSLAVLVALSPVSELSKLPEQSRPLRAALISSVLLFAVGGMIGIFISGSNVKIPAHYHGSIVGVTLALMGLAYHLLPRLGYAAPSGRLATLQPYLYGAGQLMHIVGLVWSGGYGVQRKVGGADQVLRGAGEIAGMGLMGLGGLIAIIGGLLFVIVMLRAMLAPANPASSQGST